jgi:hypothetical protein
MSRHGRDEKRASLETVCPMCKTKFKARSNKKVCSDRCKKRRLRILAGLDLLNLHPGTKALIVNLVDPS